MTQNDTLGKEFSVADELLKAQSEELDLLIVIEEKITQGNFAIYLNSLSQYQPDDKKLEANLKVLKSKGYITYTEQNINGRVRIAGILLDPSGSEKCRIYREYLSRIKK